MTRLIRVELLKLRTIRLSYGLLATAVGLTTLFAVLEATRGVAAKAAAPLSTASGLTSVITLGSWAMLLAAILGATVSSGEFRHSTATLTYLATPHRNRVLAAKAAAAACAGAVFGLAGYVAATGTGLVFVAAHGYPVAIGAATMTRYAAGYLVGGALLAAVGAGLGSLIRSQLAVVAGVFIWAIVIEPLLSGLFGSIRPYLPYTAATTLAGARIGSFAFGAGRGAPGETPLPFAAAAALLAGVALVVSAVAARTTVARDVT
jgi:ABC-type transport system involved in multi-copper enzyme maturation permease subunit